MKRDMVYKKLNEDEILEIVLEYFQDTLPCLSRYSRIASSLNDADGVEIIKKYRCIFNHLDDYTRIIYISLLLNNCRYDKEKNKDIAMECCRELIELNKKNELSIDEFLFGRNSGRNP